MMANKRLLSLAVVLALSVVAAVWVSEQPDEEVTVVGYVERKPDIIRANLTGKKEAVTTAGLALDKLPRTPDKVGDLNPFNAKSWYVPPPPPPAAPPPKPTTPPLPFAYVGKLDEGGGRWTLYLSKGEQSFVVKKGETFDGSYRLEGIENDNIVILYVPLSTKQYLPIGGLS